MKINLKDKNVLITGHTGFKGTWLSLLLKEMGATVSGYSLEPVQNPIYETSHESLFTHSWYEDIREKDKIKKAVGVSQPDFIFHLAAQPLVLDSYNDPLYTFGVNIMGTANLLEAVRGYSKKCAVIVITTDKVYENREWDYPYRENDRLGGHDPYSSSKACAELVIQSYRKSFFSPQKISEHKIALASARAGNVIGGGDWSANRIVPDIVRAFHGKNTLLIRNPDAVRPWQHVLDALSGYITLASKLIQDFENPFWQDGWNFGPSSEDNIAVKDIVSWAAEYWGNGKYEFVPATTKVHEAGQLRLDCSKATQRLGWRPVWQAKEALSKTLDWYKKALCDHEDPAAIAMEQIRGYLSLANNL
jgi:CDP-glucose 4,6-dehydratase